MKQLVGTIWTDVIQTYKEVPNTMLIKFFQRFTKSQKASFQKLAMQDAIFLYAGDVCSHTLKGPIPFTGLSLNRSDRRHIKHDVRDAIPLPDNSVSIYQSEDVFEHIEYSSFLSILDEIYRVLIPGGLFRLSMPDYRCDILNDRSVKNSNRDIIFDPGGGGDFKDGKVVDGGHLWFPTIELVETAMLKSKFMTEGHVNFLHYYDILSNSITKTIDYSKGIIKRTPDFDERVQNPRRAMSIVLDAYKA